MPEYFSSL